MALTLLSVSPIINQFGLDQLTMNYKSDAPWDTTLADGSLPEKGDAHPSYSFMFVTDIRLLESAESACIFDVIYQGAFKSSGGNPILPAAKTDQNIAVLTASSSKAYTGQELTSPATVQYYAPTAIKTYYSYNAPATANFVADPATDIIPISLTVGDTTLSITEPITNIINNFFQQHIQHTIESTEFVLGGKYWVNVSQKQKLLQPWLFAITPGAYIALFNPGQGYNIGDSLTINASGGQTAAISVTQIGSIWGAGHSILSFTVSTNTFTSSYTGLPASGGAGTDAAFNVIIIP